MKAWHGYALVAVLVLGIGAFLALIAFQVALSPESVIPLCGVTFLVGAVFVWEIAMKPWDARKEAWRNLTGKRGSPPRAVKIPRSPKPRQDAGGEGASVPPELGEHE